jgi:DNA helicase HerA-like ATPase
VVRLIRSKGVGIYFITQSPSDIPDTVLSQLGNKIQHALRAYTPKDQKAVKAAAASFRTNPEFSSETVLGELSTGEALISVLDDQGAPESVQRAFMLPPRSFMGAAEPEKINELTRSCPLYSKYGQAIDRESAYEMLEKQKKQQANAPQQKQAAQKPPTQTSKTKKSTSSKSLVNKAATSAMNTVGREVGKALIRGLLGNIKR